MIEFSNEKEISLLRVISYLILGLSLIPIFYASTGEASFADGAKGTGLFVVMAIGLSFIRWRTALKVRLLDDYLEISYPLRKTTRKISYTEVAAANYSDLGFSLSVELKGGEKISLGSTIRMTNGSFSHLAANAGDPQGEPGNRYKLKREIDRRKDQT